MAEEIKSLINDLGTTFEQFKQANDARLKEIEAKGKADPLLDEKVNKMADKLAEIESLKSRVEQAETVAARKAGTAAEDAGLEQKAKAFEAMCAKRRGEMPAGNFGAKELAGYKRYFREFMAKGDLMSLDAQKALSVGSDPDGGYTVDPDTNGRIVQKVFETSPMRSIASVQAIGTDALEGMFDLEEASSGWVGETSSRTETNTPQLGKWRIPVHEIYAFPFATQKLLDDSMVDMEAWLSAKVADKFSRTENTAFVTGDGIGKPRGFLTYSNGTTLPGTIEQFGTGVSGGFATDGSGGDVLINTIYGLKQQYRSGARWVMPRTATKEVRKLKDAEGQYLWQPGIAAGQPASLLGFGVVEFEDMPDPGANSLSIGFGNFSEAYQIVDRQGVRVLRDPYTNKPYVGFYTVKRVGGDVLNFEAIKLIRFGA